MRADKQVCLDTHAIIVVNTEGYKPMEVILSNCFCPHLTHTHSHTHTRTHTHAEREGEREREVSGADGRIPPVPDSGLPSSINGIRLKGRPASQLLCVLNSTSFSFI